MPRPSALLLLAALSCAAPPVHATPVPERAGPPHGAPAGGDPLVPMLGRIDRYVQSHEDADGVVIDDRIVVNETEAIRLSVIAQLLAYTELHAVRPSARIRGDIMDRIRFLYDRFAQVRSGSVFDGMFGYAMSQAYAATHDPRALDAAQRIADELLALPSHERVLNGGLMGAMALVDDARHPPGAAQFVDDVFHSLPQYQHANGSFPHWCYGSTDVHYTDWMGTEMILIRRAAPRPDLASMLDRMRGFIASRVGADGATSYADTCADGPGCLVPYWSIATGCGIDYDTRAWTNELGYSALLLDGTPAYARVMRFLGALESGGTWPDKWAYWSPLSDPYSVWERADTSVVNTSLIFWSLASVLRERHGRLEDGALDDHVTPLPRGPRRMPALPEFVAAPWQVAEQRALGVAAVPGDDAAAHARPGVPRIEVVGAAGAWRLRGAAPPGARLAIAIVDAQGRRVRALATHADATGAWCATWDARDDAGAHCASGVYFAAAGASGTARIAVVR